MSVSDVRPLGKPIAIGQSPDIFLNAADPITTLAIWRRQLDEPLLEAAQVLSEKAFQVVTPLNPHSKDDQQRFKQELISATEHDCALLLDDLLDLSERYAKLSQTQNVRMRIETVEDGGCRRFHLDNVVMRLVVTYCGSGTQWVLPEFAAAAHAQQTNYAGPVNSVDTGDVAIFRGKKSGAENLIFHRSPPLKPGSPARLVAVIDSFDA